MWSNSVAYYRPYSESDSDSGSDTESTGFSQDSGPNFAAFAKGLKSAGGPSLRSVKEQLEYDINQYSPANLPESKPDAALTKQYGATKFATESKQQTSLIMLESRNRDRHAYPQPTYYTLRLPRTYRNVVNIQLTQQKLLCTFYYFRPEKENVYISLQEQGRYQLNTSTLQTFKKQIRTGSYDIFSLVTEINNRLNQTPLFYYYPNGYEDFSLQFQASGNYSLNFNETGDSYYDPITQTFTANVSKIQVTQRFWKTINANQTSYTNDEIKVSYYYPPLKWAVMNSNYSFLNLSAGLTVDPTVTTEFDLINRILYTFTGIDDSVILAVINANTLPQDSNNRLDAYRNSNTFLNFPVNKYLTAIETPTQKITISATTLNTSLVNLFNKQYGIYLSNALLTQGLSLNSYLLLTPAQQQLNALLQSMYTYLQEQFNTFFAVPWNQYDVNYYANKDWSILLRNGNNVVGIPNNSYESSLSNIQTYSSNIFTVLQRNPNYLWKRYTGATVSNTIYMCNLSNTDYSNLNYPYDILTGTFITSNAGSNIPFIDASGQFYTDSTHTVNCIVPIAASKYTIFAFISPVRQNLQVESLPRPLQYRLSNYNAVYYDALIASNFNKDYDFVSNSALPYSNSDLTYETLYDNLPSNYLYSIPSITWGQSLTDAKTAQQSAGGANQLIINTYGQSLFYKLTTPVVPLSDPNSNYRYHLQTTVLFGSNSNVTSSYQPIVTQQSFSVFMYHDRGAFQADAASTSNKIPIHYIASNSIPAGVSTITTIFATFPNQEYYFILRPDSIPFGKIYASLLPWFTSSTPSYDILTNSIVGLNPATDVFTSNFYTSNFNYAKLYDPAYIRLPIQSTLWSAEPFADPSTETLPISQTPFGYDSNGVSIDFNDYIPYLPNNSNITYEPLKSKSGIDPINQYQYLNNNSISILTPGFESVYTPSTPLKREIKLCHYYSPTYFNDVDSSIFTQAIMESPGQLPYTRFLTPTPLRGYTYSNDLLSRNVLTLGSGCIGFTFIPTEGVWDINRVMFRSAIATDDPSLDPNRQITYLGVFNTLQIHNQLSNTIFLSNAIAVLSSVKTQVYLPSSTDEDVAGYDSKGGTYYLFEKISTIYNNNSNTNTKSISATSIIGYIQLESNMTANPKNCYSLIAFDANSNLTFMRAVSGSLVPYPFYNNVQNDAVYLDGSLPPDPSFDVVYPTAGPQTQYTFVPSSEQSNYAPPANAPSGTQAFPQIANSSTVSPIGTTALHYIDSSGVQVTSAWQIFYPFQKISLTKITNSESLIADSNTINYPEYPHTQLFYYSNYTSLSNDIFNSWGLESSNNFIVSDTLFNGAYFNSYIFDVPLRASLSNDYQYLALRNYSPTESSQVMMRFTMPNMYDFGYASFNELIDEINQVKISFPNTFNTTYAECISTFNGSFILSNTFGANILPNYYGSTIITNSFEQFINTYSNIYSAYTTSSQLLSSINDTALYNLNTFISQNYSNILPSNALNRQNYTGSIPFSLLWKSSLSPNYLKAIDNWGLGFNLGFAKQDTPFGAFFRSESIYKILDEYVYLRLNPEFKMNVLDSTAPENLSVTRDPTGQTANYHAKILLANFGSYAQTSVITAASLNPPVPKLEQISFELLDTSGLRIDNNDCEWSATLQIVEQTNQATTASVLPKLE